MEEAKLICLNLEEIRRRSIVLWRGLPEDFYNWKPDDDAMTALEMIRHVLAADYGWTKIIKGEDMSNFKSPWDGVPLKNVAQEIEMAVPYREEFINTVKSFSIEDLKSTNIIHPGNGKEKPLGQYILRIGYHEAVHAGQFISYLRSMKLPRPFIWD